MKIVVPCDFTPVVDYAIHHVEKVVDIASDLDIHLLHILEKGKSLKECQVRLEDLAKEYSLKLGVKVLAKVREGAVADEIPFYAEQVKADLIIMGTHGIRGVQKFVGSRAIKVVVDSNVPFLVVQKLPESSERFKRVVMPLGFRPVEVEKFKWAVQKAQGESEIYVLIEHYTDSSLIAQRDKNLLMMRRIFEGNNVKFLEREASRGEGVKSATLKYAEEVQADMLLIMITQSVGGLAPMFNSLDQDLIANSLGLPVMCVTPSMA